MTATPLSELPTPKTAERLGRAREAISNASCDVLIVSKLENIRYLSGFSGSAGVLVVTPEGATLITDSRYRDQAGAQLGEAHVSATIEIAGGRKTLDAIVAAFGGATRIGLEADSCSWSQQRRIADRLADQELIATSGVVESLRRVKDDGELARIERVIADEALDETKARLCDAITERQFAAELEFAMSRRGSAGPAFSTIVASGMNGAMPHARPTDRAVEKGDLVVVDFGATVDGYRSDITRTFSVGTPTDDLRALVDAVFDAQQAGVSAIEVGAMAAHVDETCRESLRRSGYGEFFTHSTGHGVGLEIHEAPWVASGSEEVLDLGTVVTVEPGAYLPGRGGVRIEDTVVVTQKGARVLTNATKDYLL